MIIYPNEVGSIHKETFSLRILYNISVFYMISIATVTGEE